MGRLRYGRYETLGVIASGGMAKVHLGRARGPAGFERLVAIKVMHEHISGDPDFSSMFLDEARLAARIRHPNVVPTLDVSEDGHIIVMEYIEGAALSAILRMVRKEPPGRPPLPVSLRIVLDMLEGLHAAHELRERDGTALELVHRDVSPHNVLVGIDGVSRITDFGIAFAAQRITSTRDRQLKGKMPYMAPEQLEGKPVDRRVDVYAAGCVLWELLVGERLFVADNDAALACRILAGPTRSPRSIDPSVPPAIDEVCMRALQQRKRRFGTALELAEALETAATEAGIGPAKPRVVGELARRAQTPVGPPASEPGGMGDAEPRVGTRTRPGHGGEPVAATPAAAGATTEAATADPRQPAARPEAQLGRSTAADELAQSVPGTAPHVAGAGLEPLAIRAVAVPSDLPDAEAAGEEANRPLVPPSDQPETPWSASGAAGEHTGTAPSIVSSILRERRRARTPWIAAAVGTSAVVAVAAVLLVGSLDNGASEPPPPTAPPGSGELPSGPVKPAAARPAASNHELPGAASAAADAGARRPGPFAVPTTPVAATTASRGATSPPASAAAPTAPLPSSGEFHPPRL